LLPPLGLLLNGQPFSAIFNLLLIVFLPGFRADFPRPAAGALAHALIAVDMKREDRRHREMVGGDPPARPAARIPALTPWDCGFSRKACA